jgi:hypothetical protein
VTRADWKDAGGATLYAFEYANDKVGSLAFLTGADAHFGDART